MIDRGDILKKKFTIEVEMEERWIDDFCSMLKEMERLGNIGSSKKVGIYSDGDGDFRPKFDIDIEYSKVPPIINTNKEKIYDAG